MDDASIEEFGEPDTLTGGVRVVVDRAPTETQSKRDREDHLGQPRLLLACPNPTGRLCAAARSALAAGVT